MENLSDQALIEEAKRDINAFSVLYERYVDRIYNYLYRRTWNVELAQDLTSATFETALTKIKGFKEIDGGFPAWLYRIAGNKLKNAYRRKTYLSLFSIATKADDKIGQEEMIEYKEHQRAISYEEIIDYLVTAGFSSVEGYKNFNGDPATPEEFYIFQCRKN